MTSWDRNLKYEDWEKKLEDEIKALRIEKEYYELKGLKRSRTSLHLAYNAILLAQLVNGSRISEAVQAVMQFAADKKREQSVDARKRRAHKKARIFIVPKTVKVGFFDVLEGRTEKQITNGVMQFALNHHHINTHSLRYAFVSYQNRKGTPATVTAGILRHSNVGMIEHYSRDQEADEIFRSMVEGK